MKKIGKFLYDNEEHKIYLCESNQQGNNTDYSGEKKYKNLLPITEAESCRKIVIILSQSCNLGCQYCYAGQGGYNKDTYNKLTFERCEQIISFITTKFPQGIEQIQYFGGEPLLEYRAIEYISEKLKKIYGSKCPSFTLVTNGTIINDDIIRIIKKYNIYMTISLDGIKDTHDINRYFKKDKKGSFEIITNNIEIYLSNDIKIMLQITLDKLFVNMYKNTRKEIIEKFAYQIKTLGIKRVHLAPVIAEKGTYFDMNIDEIKSLKNFYQEVLTRFEGDGIVDSSKLSLHHFLKNKVRNPKYCGAGLDELTIDLDGKIYPCFMFINTPYVIGDIFSGIERNDYLKEIEGLLKAKNKKCSSCIVKDSCSMCIGANYIRSGKISENAPIFCGFKQAGYEKNLELLAERVIENER